MLLNTLTNILFVFSFSMCLCHYFYCENKGIWVIEKNFVELPLYLILKKHPSKSCVAVVVVTGLARAWLWIGILEAEVPCRIFILWELTSMYRATYIVSRYNKKISRLREDERKQVVHNTTCIGLRFSSPSFYPFNFNLHTYIFHFYV